MNGIQENQKNQKHAQNVKAHIGTGQGKERKKKHGWSGTKLYKRWHQLKRRCLDEKCTSYNYYGGRGITICEDWKEFINFKDWALKNGYKENLQIDRVDNNGDYTPENCRFVTPEENIRNSRITKLNYDIAEEIRMVHAKGELTKTKIGLVFGISRNTVKLVVDGKAWKNRS